MEKTVRKFSSHEEMRLFQNTGRQSLDAATRLSETRGLVIFYRELQNIQPREPKFLKRAEKAGILEPK